MSAELDELVFADQAHGNVATIVSRQEAGRGCSSMTDAIGGTDALVTNDPQIVLVILVADCTPVLLFDPEAGVLACAHAGWRGTVSGVLESTLDSMALLGARPQSTQVGIGPAVAQGAYQVGEEVVRCAASKLGEAIDEVARADGTGRWIFDLSGASRAILVHSGVPAANIHMAPACTGPNGPFFSDRATRPCGRFGLLARIRR